MKLLDRLINFIFSLAMIVISVVVLLVVCNFTSSSFINGIINDYVWNPDYSLIVASVAGVVFLAALKTTIFLSDFKKNRKIPIMVSSDNGSVQIASETIDYQKNNRVIYQNSSNIYMNSSGYYPKSINNSYSNHNYSQYHNMPPTQNYRYFSPCGSPRFIQKAPMNQGKIIKHKRKAFCIRIIKT